VEEKVGDEAESKMVKE